MMHVCSESIFFISHSCFTNSFPARATKACLQKQTALRLTVGCARDSCSNLPYDGHHAWTRGHDHIYDSRQWGAEQLLTTSLDNPKVPLRHLFCGLKIPSAAHTCDKSTANVPSPGLLRDQASRLVVNYVTIVNST